MRTIKRSDITGFTLNIGKIWVEVVIVKHIPRVLAINIGKHNGKTYRIGGE